MRNHDAILGQPWIQWFAARIDFDREGTMKMMVWQDGDRANQPTLQLQLTQLDDPRNITALRRNAHQATVDQEPIKHHFHCATIEEVSEDDEGMYF